MNEKLEALNQEIEKTEKKLQRAQHEEKMLEHQIKTLTRKERTHRLCTRAAMLESYLPHPEAITDEQVSLFLKLLFHKDSTRQLMEKVFAGNGNFQGSLIRSSGLSRIGTIPSGAGLPKPRHRRGRKSHIPREKSQTGNGHNRFQSRNPWTAPLKEGATIHHLKVVCCALPGLPAESG